MKLLRPAGLFIIALCLSVTFLEAQYTKHSLKDVKTENRKTAAFTSINRRRFF